MWYTKKATMNGILQNPFVFPLSVTTHTHTPVMPECEQMLDDVIMAPRDTLVTRQRLTKGGPEFGDQRGPDTR